MKLKTIISGIALMSIGALSSCSDYLDVNDNPDSPSLDKVGVNTLLPWTQYHLAYATGAHGYRSQFICGAFTSTSRTIRDGCSAMWEATTSLTTTSYQQFFVGAGPSLATMIEKGNATGAYHYVAAAKILKSYGFLLMVDMYGEMPYDEANTAAAMPRYDTGEYIYNGCLKDIDEAIELLGKDQAAGAPALSEGDSWNGGDVNKWIKMAYLLKARTLNNLSKKSQYYDADAILAALENAQQSIDDDTYINCEDVKENSSDFISGDPMKTNYNWDQTYNGNRHTTLPSKWLTDLLENFDNKGVEDPRADKIIAWREFNVNGVKTWQRGKGLDMSTDIRLQNGLIANFITRKDGNNGWKSSNTAREADSVYVGIYAGSAGVYGNPGVLYIPSTYKGWYASSGNVYVRPNSPYLWATYTEACFIKAEVLMRKGEKNGAFEAYKAGIKANIDELNKMLTLWNASDYNNCPSFGQMTQDKIDDFLNNAIGTASDISMEKIMTQKFIAMLYSTVNWNDMRRHDYNDYMGWQIPYEYSHNSAALKKIPEGKMWRRFQQCSHELQKNVTQLQAAQPHYADDDIWTYPVWWDEAD